MSCAGLHDREARQVSPRSDAESPLYVSDKNVTHDGVFRDTECGRKHARKDVESGFGRGGAGEDNQFANVGLATARAVSPLST